MIQKFADRFIAARTETEAWIREQSYPTYPELVEKVVKIIREGEEWGGDCPDPSRITTIDHGDYQGTLIFVLAAGGYQPSKYWFVRVYYGSCSGCDTLQVAIERDWNSSGEPRLTDQSVQDVWTLMLHIVQNIKELDGE